MLNINHALLKVIAKVLEEVSNVDISLSKWANVYLFVASAKMIEADFYLRMIKELMS